MNALLTLSHVTKIYRQGGMLGRRQIVAVKDVSFEIGSEPEILSIVGESGSGKSTIAAMILGQTAPTQGILHFRGKAVALHGKGERRAFMTHQLAAEEKIFGDSQGVREQDLLVHQNNTRFLRLLRL